jgi:ethanolamine utilization protein EutA
VIDEDAFAATVARHFTAFDLVEGDVDVAIALHWSGLPEYSRVAALARGLLKALPKTVAAGRPLYVILDGDLARTLGGVLREDLGLANELLVIDGIVLWDFDYIDLGRIRLPSGTVPVTVKSLVFSQDPHAPAVTETHKHHHHHHHDQDHDHDHGSHHDHDHGHEHSKAGA